MESVEVILGLVGTDTPENLTAGQEFEVTFSALDLRVDRRDTVYSFYTDVTFDPSILRAVQIDYNDDLSEGGGYQFAQTGMIDNVQGLIEEVGATSGQVLSSVSLSPVVFTVRFELLRAAPVVIETNAAEALLSQTTVYGQDLDQRSDIKHGSLAIDFPSPQPPLTPTPLTPIVAIDATNANATESDGGGSFTVSRTGETTEALEVELSISGTATNGDDYQTIAETITINAGESAVEIPFSVFDDSLEEPSETVILAVTERGQYDVDGSRRSATVTITDNDVSSGEPVVTIEAVDAIATEPGDDGAEVRDDGLFVISRTGSLAEALEVKYRRSGNAIWGLDYQPLPRPVIIAAGERSVAIPVSVLNDGFSEADERVSLTLRESRGYTLGDRTTATVTIVDQPQPVVTIAATDAIAAEQNDSGLFTISRTGSVSEALKVRLNISGSASNGIDYQRISRQVTIAAGERSIALPVTVLEDGLTEGSEVVSLKIANSSRYEVGENNEASVTITEQSKPVVTIAATDALAAEPNDHGLFTISRTGSLASELQVKFSIAGSAIQRLDYQSFARRVTIPAGAASVDVPIMVVSDSLVETDETVVLKLKGSSRYDIGQSDTATVVIQDQPKPLVTIEATNAVAAEGGDRGTFTISRAISSDSALDVRVNISGNARNGSDYQSITRRVIIPAGERSVEVSIDAIADGIAESDETVTLRLAPKNRYEIGAASTATLTVVSEENVPSPARAQSFSQALAEPLPQPSVSSAAADGTLSNVSIADNQPSEYGTDQPSGEEQYLLELANRFRLNPAAEYDALLNAGDADVERALGFFGVDLTELSAQWDELVAAQPLAWSDQLFRSATTHNQLMIDFNQQQHNLPGEADLPTRIGAAGGLSYGDVGENIYAFSESPFYGHAGFAIDWGDDNNNPNDGFGTGIQPGAGHRTHLLNSGFNEAGFSILTEDDPATKVGPLSITQHFGSRPTGSTTWLLGTAFRDLDDDNFYSVGEGLSDVTVHISSSAGFRTAVQTGLAGGYQTLVPAGSYQIEFVRQGESVKTLQNVVVDGQNVKRDLHINGSAGPDAGLGKIVGTQFDDENNNGVRDFGEPGIAGRSLFLDTNGNRTLDSDEPFTLTDANGLYAFNNLQPGSYSVVPVLPTGRSQTFPNNDLPGSETYRLDDGDEDGWTTFTRGGDTLIFNQFEANTATETLTSLSVGLSARGNPTQLFIYEDANGNDRPDGNELRLSVVPSLVKRVGFAQVAIAPTAVSGTFFIGALYEGSGERDFTWIPRDKTSPAGKSWRAVSADPENFSTRLSSTSNWLLRANAAGLSSQTVRVAADETVSGVDFGDFAEAVGTPTLAVNSFDVDNDHILTGQADITFSLRNEGAGGAAAFEVGFVYSNDEIIGNSDDITLDTLLLGGLNSGEQLTQRVSLSLPRDLLNSQAQADDITGLTAGHVSNSTDYIGIVVDPNNLLAPGTVSSAPETKGIDYDDVTYFPWDTDGDGTVTLTDAEFAIARLGQQTSSADFDGNGLVSATDSLAVINRLGYEINPGVFE